MALVLESITPAAGKEVVVKRRNLFLRFSF